MTRVVGIDGGGTRTRAVLLEADGRVLGVGESGPGNLHDMGPERLRDHVAEAWQGAWRAAGEAPTPCDGAFFGMASVVTQADRDIVHAIGVELGLAPAEAIGVDVDLRVALAGGLAGRDGIVVIAGTGSSAFGRTADGRAHMASGWGSTLDDRGSAHDLGHSALVACAFAADGRARATSLMPAIRAELGLGDDWRELMARVDVLGMRRAEIAGLARIVTREARAGDRTAREIVESGTFELAKAVEAVAHELGVSDPEVVAVGGLAQSGPEWRLPFERAVHARLPRARFVEPQLPPGLGACLVAFESLGVDLSEAALASLVERFQPELSAWRRGGPLLPVHGEAEGATAVPGDALYVGFDALAERCRDARRILLDGCCSVFWADFATGLQSALARVGRSAHVIDATRAMHREPGDVATLTDHYDPDRLRSLPGGEHGEIEIVHGTGSFLVEDGDLRVWCEVPERETEARRATTVLCELDAMHVDPSHVRAHLGVHRARVDLVCDVQRPGVPMAVEASALRPGAPAARCVAGDWQFELETWLG